MYTLKTSFLYLFIIQPSFSTTIIVRIYAYLSITLRVEIGFQATHVWMVHHSHYLQFTVLA